MLHSFQYIRVQVHDVILNNLLYIRTKQLEIYIKTIDIVVVYLPFFVICM